MGVDSSCGPGDADKAPAAFGAGLADLSVRYFRPVQRASALSLLVRACDLVVCVLVVGSSSRQAVQVRQH